MSFTNPRFSGDKIEQSMRAEADGGINHEVSITIIIISDISRVTCFSQSGVGTVLSTSSRLAKMLLLESNESSLGSFSLHALMVWRINFLMLQNFTAGQYFVKNFWADG